MSSTVTVEPLAEAAKVGNARLVGMLLDAGSNVEVPNQEGQTALMLAARAGSLEVAELLCATAPMSCTRKMARSDGTDVAVAARSAELTRFLIAHKRTSMPGRWRTTGRAR